MQVYDKFWQRPHCVGFWDKGLDKGHRIIHRWYGIEMDRIQRVGSFLLKLFNLWVFLLLLTLPVFSPLTFTWFFLSTGSIFSWFCSQRILYLWFALVCSLESMALLKSRSLIWACARFKLNLRSSVWSDSWNVKLWKFNKKNDTKIRSSAFATKPRAIFLGQVQVTLEYFGLI